MLAGNTRVITCWYHANWSPKSYHCWR